jgi:hypothetical protein
MQPLCHAVAKPIKQILLRVSWFEVLLLNLSTQHGIKYLLPANRTSDHVHEWLGSVCHLVSLLGSQSKRQLLLLFSAGLAMHCPLFGPAKSMQQDNINYNNQAQTGCCPGTIRAR